MRQNTHWTDGHQQSTMWQMVLFGGGHEVILNVSSSSRWRRAQRRCCWLSVYPSSPSSDAWTDCGRHSADDIRLCPADETSNSFDCNAVQRYRV